MNGQTEIDSINAILKLSRRFNWDNFSISHMIEFYQLCLKHGLRISHYPQERALEQFQITRANCEPDEVEAIYFTLVQIPVMTGLLKLLGEPQAQFKELEQRIIKMETLLTDTHKGVQTLVQQDEYLYYLQYFQQKSPYSQNTASSSPLTKKDEKLFTKMVLSVLFVIGLIVLGTMRPCVHLTIRKSGARQDKLNKANFQTIL